MKFILGKKLKMSQVWDANRKVVPVTIVEAGPCVVTQVKNNEKDHYNAIQFGFGKRKKNTKPATGHLKELGLFQYLRECRLEDNVSKIGEQELKRGEIINVEMFTAGDKVSVTGLSKGKGFQGVVRRHGFHGQPKTHGHKDQLRMPGAISAGGVQHVFKGTKMAGRMGTDRVTMTNLKIVAVDKEKNLLFIKGAVPGAKGALLQIVA